MGDLLMLKARRRERRAKRRQPGGTTAIVHPFPGDRHLRMVQNIAAHMAKLNDYDKAEEFLDHHLEIEEARLTDQGVSDPEIDRYLFEIARAVFARMRKLIAGVA